ncbi:protein lin-54 homolog isoform X2 [Aethina tumida]|uniref:protein lin-54 homolog isoform X2 n=1 Tax=Aethina tumida TaxID=116153 RepID=UPI00096B4462|nr:protein lin-54 homolog isoform X2 [Aethina tumida]
MSYSDKGEDAETALVESLAMEGAITDANLAGLTTNDLHALSQLSQELTLTADDMETEESLVSESEVVVDAQEEIEHEEEVVVQTELGAEEIEIETETAEDGTVAVTTPSGTMTLSTMVEESNKRSGSAVPPLRPLTIAPKPQKIPVTAVKPLAGQQLLLLQGTGTGQAIKLVSPQGQELNLANLALSRPLTIKPAIKTITSQGNISLVQPKPVVMKKILTQGQKIQKPLQTIQNKQGQQYMVVQKSGEPGQQMKLIQGTSIQTIPSPTKTITLQQAQEMGLLSPKMLPQTTTTTTQKHTVLINKNPQKTIKIMPQTTQMITGNKTISLKSPTKILPATSLTTNKAQQRIIFKSTTGGQTVLPPGQIIQLTGNQSINSGQLHQINIPGKGMQYIKFVTSTADANTTLNTVKTTTQSVTPNHMVLSEIKPVLAPKTVKTVPQKLSMTASQQPVMITYPIPQGTATKVAIPQRHSGPVQTASTPAPKPTPVLIDGTTPAQTDGNLESNGIRPRKPCNCTKSQCLKLYCDCFANGEFCYMCNCMNCYNNLDNEDHRQRAIKACLERNPHAFRPKIGKAKDTAGEMAVRKHTKGCNCKRSGCLKNYCECYEAKIACSNNCKCVGCRNIEDTMEKKNIRISSIMDNMSTSPPLGKSIPNRELGQFRPRRSSNSGKQPTNYITDDVIEATCQCLLTISDSAENNMQDEEVTKAQIIEEFGRCLTEIIECSSSRNLN